jgi:uncharacterized protein YigE (DUF2233 family)
MTKVITTVLFLLCFLFSNAQLKELQNYNYHGSTFDIAIVKYDSMIFNNLKIILNEGSLNENDFFDSLVTAGSFIAFTAGSVDNNNNLLGLFIKDGFLKKTINLNSGTGNFFIKPNGYYSFKSSGIDINQTSAFMYSQNHFNAVQSGPMLLLNGSINTAFDKNSINRNIRLGIGSYDANNQQFLVIVKSKTPVTFYEFADLFLRKFNCRNAIYLDGGDNCSLHLSSSNINDLKNNKANKFIYIKL